jgi:hypothetical protein
MVVFFLFNGAVVVHVLFVPRPAVACLRLGVADVCREYVRALKGLALPRASHSGEIALSDSRRLRSTLVAAPAFLRTLLSQLAKTVHPPPPTVHPPHLLRFCCCSCADAKVAAVMRRVCALFALSNIMDGHQWAGLIDATTESLVETTIADLLAEIRPDAVSLVDAFEFHDRVRVCVRACVCVCMCVCV